MTITRAPLLLAAATALAACQASDARAPAGRAASIVAADDTYLAVGNTQLVVGAPRPATPHVFVAGSVLDNDAGRGLSASVVSPPAGGAVDMAADGRFIYTPKAGFRGLGGLGTDAFRYRVSDATGASATALVTIDLRDADKKVLLVWYVDARSTGPAADGTSARPFSSMAPVRDASADGDVIFVHEDGGRTEGGLALRPGQILWGNANPLSLGGGRLVIPRAGRPTLSGPVVSAPGATISSLGIATSEMNGVIPGPGQTIADVVVHNDCPGVSAVTLPAAPLLSH